MKIRIKPFTTCVYLELLLADIICIGNLFQMSQIVTPAFLLTFIILIYMVMNHYSKEKITIAFILLIVLSILNVVLNASLSTHSNISFDYFKKCIMFLSAISFFVIVADTRIDEKHQRMAIFFGLLVSLLFAFSYYVLNNHAMLGRFLTMGFTNPNFTAFWVLHGVIYSVYFFFYSKKTWAKLAMVIIIVSLLYIEYLTMNRSVWVSLVMFAVLLLIGIGGKLRALNPIVITGIILAPIIIVLIYHYLLSNSLFLRLFSFMASEGKDLSSRSIIWDFAIEKFKNSAILGDYSGISNGTGISQMHNTHLDILSSYGLVPFVLFLIVIRKLTLKVSTEVNDFSQYIAFCGFLSIIVFGTFEASLFSGCTGLNYLSGAFLILAKQAEKEGYI